MQYAIIETGGKQYRVKSGDVLFVEKLPVQAEDEVTFDKVLAVLDDEKEAVRHDRNRCLLCYQYSKHPTPHHLQK